MSAPKLTLNPQQLSNEAAQELLALLEAISADGRLDDAEILKLDEWLSKAGKENVPAITFLRHTVSEVLADRVIIDEERKTIVGAILRILPPEESVDAGIRFSEAEESDKQKKSWELKQKHDHTPATKSQLCYLNALGIPIPPKCTKSQASELIDEAICAHQPVTPRQMMVLRFWNHEHLAAKGRHAVSEWTDTWYAGDPDRLTAWNLWRESIGDLGRDDPPEKVPVGAGPEFLVKVKEMSDIPAPKKRVSPTFLGIAIAGLAAILIAAGILIFG